MKKRRWKRGLSTTIKTLQTGAYTFLLTGALLSVMPGSLFGQTESEGNKNDGAQENSGDRKKADDSEDSLLPPIRALQTMKIHGYGSVNYMEREEFQADFERKYFKETDLERFVLKLESELAEDVEFEVELEYEHGGTGSTMELDAVEEFGEFEQEVEAGGEVIVEELYLSWHPVSWFRLRGGHFYVPIGHLPFNYRPGDYHTAIRGEAETRIAPAIWHETGLDVSGNVNVFRYQVGVVNGLDSSGFSSRNWIRGGHQTRFEKARANELAYFARLDANLHQINRLSSFLKKGIVGYTFYYGGSAKNRPKDDFKRRMLFGIDQYGQSPETGSADVKLYEFHADLESGPFGFRWMYLYGTLENADMVTAANKTVSNNLGVPRTPVASAAEAWFYELSFNALHFFNRKERLDLYLRYDYTDSMADIERVIDVSQNLYYQNYTVDNPRWRWRTKSAGVHFRPLDSISLKFQYSSRRIGTGRDGVQRPWGPEYDLIEESYIASLGFQF